MDHELVEARLREHFGSAAPFRRTASAGEALRRAMSSEAIAVLAEPVTGMPESLRLLEVLSGRDGRTIAYAFGRVAADDVAPEAPSAARARPLGRQASWSPRSWRSRPAEQLAHYPDLKAVARVERRLACSRPLVGVADIMRLRAALADVAAGKAFLLQGGDCAESFAEFSSDKIRALHELLVEMGAILSASSMGEVVHVARIAGQFAKPRSAPIETVGGVTLPCYRGDAVNGLAFTPADRTPDPRRLLAAHRQAEVTIQLLESCGASACSSSRQGGATLAAGVDARAAKMFTSHEALLLNYEEALTRYDEASGQYWAMSAHMLWIGDRTRQLDGAHVEYARGVGNPVGVKCGPGLEPNTLLRLIDRLDPDNRPGRLVLIGRFGAERIDEHLPKLMRATRNEGRRAIWSIDPMHGNTRRVQGMKTRFVCDILDEVRRYFAIAASEGVRPGGVHLEMTGSDVTECMGGSGRLERDDLARNYLSHCDPRLNRRQSLELAYAVAKLLEGPAGPRANAA
jgi:3-deoxy-7-phosphoheptulonate synthase